MAKEAKPEAAAAPGSSKKLLIIVAALLVVILVIGAAGAFFLMKKHGADDADDDDEVPVETVKSKKKAAKDLPPVYVAMDAFTVNLASEPGGEQFVQLILSVEVSDAGAGEQIKAYTPKIRNNVMMMLSGKKASELLTREGKEKLAVEIRDQMNQVLDPKARADDAPVKEVLFTSFIIQ
ncbi:MAG: flagellar basal body-associated FliL family protein [Candidatus Accumulibacter sp.]|jgi:flagellar FliL protein|nr:flagellar basal body-associated FliL family protein [Accumulibacter sp.]